MLLALWVGFSSWMDFELLIDVTDVNLVSSLPGAPASSAEFPEELMASKTICLPPFRMAKTITQESCRKFGERKVAKELSII
jgi:hypothetical protein